MKNQSWLLLLPLLLSSTSIRANERIAGIAIASDDHVYVWHKDGMVTSGTSGNFEDYKHASPYTLPPGKKISNIVAISIAGSDDHVYAWYDDGTVSSGTSKDLDSYRAPYKYTLPPGKTIKSIVGIGIAKNDRVYTWYEDITVSVGSTDNLDKHQAPEFYSLPIGKIAANIVEIDIAKSNDHVYVWYRDGTASSGSSKHLDSHRPAFGYVPAQVLYRWWGPNQQRVRPSELKLLDSSRKAGLKITEHYPGLIHETEAGTRFKPQSRPDADPNDSGTARSPAYSTRFETGSGSSVDPMIAAGNQYLIVSDTGRIAFFDKQGVPLPEKNGIGSSFSANKFFEGFVEKTNADGSVNETNINLYMDYPKPCDSPDYPQTSSGRRFCIATFYDTRVFFDATSKRFFVLSNSRHPLWRGEKYKKDYGTCGVYTDSNDNNVGTDTYCTLARRYVAFAVSKTEDPRDGFHQYMITENNYRDWPWMTVNGNAFVVAHRGGETTTGPVATVFSLIEIKAGDAHPPYFRYYSKHVNGIETVLPPTHHQNATGLVYLLGNNGGTRLDIFAFPQTVDHWTAPALLNTSVEFSAEKPRVLGAVFRQSKLYLVSPYKVEEKGAAERYSVRVVRLPVEKLGASLIKASTDSSKGYMDGYFGRNASSDSPEDRVSYERPSMAVNKTGDMLFGYGRYPFVNEKTLHPEARYSLWYGSESKQRRGALLRAGEAANTNTINSAIDYTTAVVDPADDTSFWVALPYVNNGGTYKTVVGKISP